MRHFYGLQDNIIIDRAFALSNVFFLRQQEQQREWAQRQDVTR